MTAREALTWLFGWALIQLFVVAVGVILTSVIVCRASVPAASSSQHAEPLSLPSGMTPDVAARSGPPEPAPTTSPVTASGPVATSSPAAAASLRGVATWYRYVEGQAAAGPALRAALGDDWRGRTVVVRVAPDGPGLAVVLTDFCLCGDRDGRPTLLDLDRRDFARLAPPSWGVLGVEVTW